MPTLIDHASNEVSRLEALELAARTALASYRGEQLDAKQSYEAALADRVEREAAVAAIRKALGNAEVAPAASSGAEDLREKLVDLRASQAAVLAAKQRLRAAEDELAAAESRAASLRTQLQQARQQHEQASARAKDIEAWGAAVTTGAAAGVPGAAAALASAPEFAAAETKVVVALQELRDRASARLAESLAREQALRDHLIELEDSRDGLLGAVPALERALARADAALADFARRGADRLREAEALLASIARRPVIADEIRDALASNPARIAAAGAEQAVEDEAVKVREKQLEIELFIAKLLAANPDADVDGNTDVTDLRSDLVTLEGQLQAAQNNYEASGASQELASWQADVPASAWADLFDLERARNLLTSLAAMVPADLINAVTTAETALVDGLVDELVVARSEALVGDTVAAVARKVARDTTNANESHRAALEGLR